MKQLVLSVLLILLLSYSGITHAQDVLTVVKPITIKPLLGGSLEMGGESVAEVIFTNGETQDMPAGQGGSIFGGVEISFSSLQLLTLRSTIGYKYLTTAADNVHIRLTRVPIHFSANLMLPQNIRIGAGISTHRSIRLNSDGLSQNVDFKAATAPAFEVAWKWVGLSVVPMKYVATTGEAFDATAIGLTFSGTLPAKKLTN